MKPDDRILITGARGLVGSAVANHLRQAGYANLIEVGRDTCDLTDTAATIAAFERARPDYVFHAAARVYGIMGNLKNKALSFFDNVMINTNVVEASHRVGVKKIAAMGTGAVYPYPSPGLPLKEDMIFLGKPHPAEDSYAQAKRAMLAMLQAYEESYGIEWVYLVSCNLFGPRDKFDTEFGHVVPSLIKKFHDARQGPGQGHDLGRRFGAARFPLRQGCGAGDLPGDGKLPRRGQYGQQPGAAHTRHRRHDCRHHRHGGPPGLGREQAQRPGLSRLRPVETGGRRLQAGLFDSRRPRGNLGLVLPAH
jgi:hypothetical protein